MELVKAIEVRRYLSPRYWPAWIAIGLLRTVALLPLPVIVALGSLLGQILYYVASKRRQVSQINLRIAFPNLSEAAIRKLNRASFRNLVIGVFEMGLAWWEPKRLLAVCEVDGLEHLKNAQTAGKGVIVLTAHFTSLEAGGPKLNQYVPLQAMYKRLQNDLLDAFMRRGRAAYTKCPSESSQAPRAAQRTEARPCYVVCARSGFRSKRYRLRTVLWCWRDGPDGAGTNRAKYQVPPLVPYCIQRKPYGRGYRLTFLPRLEDFPSGDAEDDALAINRVMESLILRNPQQYLWMHKRYKHRADGRQGMYPSHLLADPPDPKIGRTPERARLEKG